MPSGCHLNICHVCMALWNVSLLHFSENPLLRHEVQAKVSQPLTFPTQKQLTERKVYFVHGGFAPLWHKGNIEQFTSWQLGGREGQKQQGKKRLFQDMPVRIHSQWPLPLNKPYVAEICSSSTVSLKMDLFNGLAILLSEPLLSASERHRTVFTNIIGVFKTEVVTRDWGIAVAGLTMLLFGEIWEPWDVGIEKQLNALSSA